MISNRATSTRTLFQLFLLTLARAVPQPTVDLGYTQYEGLDLGNGVSQFLGLRYAKAPTGDLRWALPQAPDRTSGVMEATEHGPLCFAANLPSTSRYGDSEDCLFADVWTPAFSIADDGAPSLNKTKLPVFVWITGGSYSQLYNSEYNGTSLVEKSGNDIVVVTFNYRVGAFGFLASEEIAQNGALNAGLMDQRFFLQWIQQNIDKFGGDPGHVTLVGTSAGAGSFLHHSTAYSGRNDNLFQAAISDSLYIPFQPRCSYYQYQYDAYVDATGCGDVDDTLACLRALDSATLNEANVAYPYPNRSEAANFSATVGSSANFPYGPCIDGDFIADGTNALLAAGKFIQVPLLLGNDNDEGSIFTPNTNNTNDVDAFFADNYPLLTLDDVTSISSETYSYLAGTTTPNHGPLFALAQTAYGESTFTCPSNNLASIYASRIPADCEAAPVWNYRYAVLSEANAAAGLGTTHTYQIAAYWGPGDPDYNEEYTTANAAVIPLVSTYWLSFVKTYDPNTLAGEGAPSWDTYGGEQSRLLFNNTGVYPEVVPPEQNARCDFWLNTVGEDLMQ